MYIFGLTGGIASGKSTVSRHLQGLGCPVIDSDIIARQVVEPDQPAWRAIIGQFGVEILQEDRTIDRSKLASIIFSDEEKRKVLNIITHPFIQQQIMFQLLKHFIKGEPFVILVSPLLFESNRFLRFMKRIITVNCTEDKQLERLMERDSVTKDKAMLRISAQMPLKEKCRRADYVIDNSSSVRFTEQQTFTLYHNIRRTSMFCGLYKWLIVFTVTWLVYKFVL